MWFARPPKNKYIDKNQPLFLIVSCPISPGLQAEDEDKPCKVQIGWQNGSLSLLLIKQKYLSNLAS